jgi:hypothetical protein
MRSAGDDALLATMDERNCGWVHNNCHPMAEGGDGRLRGIIYLIRYEGYLRVCEFTRDMAIHCINYAEFARDVNRAWDMLNKMIPAWDECGIH